jgi:uncharacterized membrane protein YkvI
MTILTVTILGICTYIGVESARVYNRFDYRGLGNNMYAPIQIVGANLFELSYLITVILGVAAVLSGGASLLNQLIGLPQILGTVLMFAVILVISIFGVKVVRAAGTWMTLGIVIIVLSVTFCGIGASWDHIKQIFAEKEVYTSTGTALYWMITYAGFQCAVIAVTACSAEGITSNRESVGAAIIGTILNFVMMFLVALMLLGFMPDVVDNKEAATLPTLFVVNSLGYGILKVFYPILLFLAYITTGVGLAFGTVQRFKPRVLKKMNNEVIKSAIITAITLFFCWLVSQLGLLWVVKMGYQYLGLANIFIVIIPFLTLGAYNLRKAHKAENKTKITE